MLGDAAAHCSNEEMHAAIDVKLPNYASAMVSTEEIVASISALKTSVRKRAPTVQTRRYLMNSRKAFIDETERPFGSCDPRPRNWSADCGFCEECNYGAAANVPWASTAFPARLPARWIAQPLHTAVC